LNWQHFNTVIWLRWRIRVNQVKRAGSINAVVTAVFFVVFLLIAFLAFVGAIPIGVFQLADVQPLVLMLVWDGLSGAFLFCWMIGVVTELQRSESLSADKFLHLPISLAGVFLVNYLSSLPTLTAVAFVPAMIGLSIGLAVSRGFVLLSALPLVAAFFFMVTALTYQFRGWLGALMSNPRRRRTIIVGITIVFVLLAQLPNLINLWAPWNPPKGQGSTESANESELLQLRRTGKISADEYLRRNADLQRKKQEGEHEANDQKFQDLAGWLRFANQILPPGWLSMGVTAAAEGHVLPPLLGMGGMSLIGLASLWRAYRTTIRYYTGQFNSARAKPKPAKLRVSSRVDHKQFMLLETRLPIVTEYASAIALSGLRSLLRAPEAKMMFLSPIILAFVFGSMIFRQSMDIEKPMRSLFAIGAVAMTLFGMVQFVGNQFAFDRGGFRGFVLCPAPRRDILMGKNLAMAPFALGIAWILIVLIAIVRPMRFDHLLAMVPQSIAMYLIFCLMANWLSIYAPMPIAPGSMRPANPRFAIIILHILFTIALPITLAPTLIPWLTEYLIETFGVATHMPIFLLGSVLELAAVVLMYYALLEVQGHTLEAREQRLLDVVSKKAE
jgi:hypothetical protein